MNTLVDARWLGKEAVRVAVNCGFCACPEAPRLKQVDDPPTGDIVVILNEKVVCTIPNTWRAIQSPEALREWLLTAVLLPQYLPHGY